MIEGNCVITVTVFILCVVHLLYPTPIVGPYSPRTFTTFIAICNTVRMTVVSWARPAV